METATLGGGCFWCLEAVYDEMEGVSSVESGYMGGRVANPDPSDSLREPTRLIRDHVLLSEATPGPLGVHRRLDRHVLIVNPDTTVRVSGVVSG